jgi:uncharacterized membrane protein
MTPRPIGASFEAVVVPHRSLSRRGRMALSAALAAMIAAAGGVFFLLGAWPVVGFCGGEIGLALLLLHLNAADARSSEVILIRDGAARITRTDRRGRRSEHVLPLSWLNVDLVERPGRVPGLFLRARLATQEVATSLGEAEKRSLAAALADAVHRARNPVFDNPQLR